MQTTETKLQTGCLSSTSPKVGKDPLLGKENFISYQKAKSLFKLGFNGKASGYFMNGGLVIGKYSGNFENRNSDFCERSMMEYISAPTLQEVEEWFLNVQKAVQKILSTH